MKIRHILPVIAVAVLPLMGACSSSGGAEHSPRRSEASQSADDVAAADTSADDSDTPEFADPQATDFLFTVKVLERQCFGSAGCNVTVKPDVTWIGLEDVDPDKTYEITYEVHGDESGPVVATMELSNGSDLSFSKSFLSTSQYTSTDEITMEVTDVEEGY